MSNKYVLPWERNGEREYIRRVLAWGSPSPYFYVWRELGSGQWRCQGWSFGHASLIGYDTAEEAMVARDEQLKNRGWILLNEKTVLLI